MPLTRLSSQFIISDNIEVSNFFILEYLPYAPENFVKVYLYGLSQAHHNVETDNNISRIAKRLMIEESVVTEAFNYWQNEGLVNILPTTPMTIEYLPVRPLASQIKKFNKDKYKSFNEQISAILPGRNILPNEYNEYYSIMESMHIEKEAMLCIISYCAKLKGDDIAFPYILAVARNLAHDGCTTYDRVQEKLSELELYSKDLTQILKAMKSRKTPDHDDKRLFIKWKQYGFSLDTILFVATKCVKGGMSRLDGLLTKYYEAHIITVIEINNYESTRDSMRKLTFAINRIIGVYLENIDYEVESYTANWLFMGYDEDALLCLADYCFRTNIRTLDAFNDKVTAFFKLGLLTKNAILGYLQDLISADIPLKEIMALLGLARPLNTRDREYYRTWTELWGLPNDVITYGAKLACGKDNPISYLNGILANYYDKGITTVDRAKTEIKPQTVATAPQSKPGDLATVRKLYTADELNAMFDKIGDDEEI